jgi:hypothetical protein
MALYCTGNIRAQQKVAPARLPLKTKKYSCLKKGLRKLFYPG